MEVFKCNMCKIEFRFREVELRSRSQGNEISIRGLKWIEMERNGNHPAG